MKASRVLFVIVAVVGLLAAYLFSDPVPDGIAEPSKYRTVMAGMRFLKIVARVTHLFHRDEPFQSYSIKFLRNVQTSVVPLPPDEVEGSNIRSRVIDLDGVSTRLYEPIAKKPGPQPAFVYYHGGGMCIGSADMYDVITRKIAEALDSVVVSIDYRLAPEHPFPAGYEDCFKATRYFMDHAADFNVDPLRIGAGGDSAGGHLTASVAQAIHDDPNLPDLKLQVLIYPSAQKINLNTPSYQKYAADFGDAGLLPLSLVTTFVSLAELGEIDPDVFSNMMINNHTSSEFKKTSVEYSYVNHDQLPSKFQDPSYYKTRNDPRTGNDAVWARLSSHLLDFRSAPLMRRDLAGLPPAYIVTCGFDLLRDDGVFYKVRLEEAGVPVTWAHYEEAFHGVLSLQGKRGFKLATVMLDNIIEYIVNNL